MAQADRENASMAFTLSLVEAINSQFLPNDISLCPHWEHIKYFGDCLDVLVPLSCKVDKTTTTEPSFKPEELTGNTYPKRK